MNIKIHNRNLDLLNNHEKLIDRHGGKIRKLLPSFSSEVIDLDVSLEKLPRGSQYETSLVLTLPQRVIKVEEIDNNPTTCIVRAFGELRRRVKRFKSQLNRERLWHRQAPAEASSPGWAVETEANDHLEKIENYLRREIYHRVLAGLMPPGLIEPQAVVDETFLRTTTQFTTKPSDLSLEQWMFRLARQILAERLDELEAGRDHPHMEESASTGDKWEDEDLNFYQPDESLSVEDLLKDGGGSNPEEILARDEIEEKIHGAIAKLPAEMRESFVLFALEGFTSDEVSMMTGKERSAILSDVEEARKLLKERM